MSRKVCGMQDETNLTKSLEGGSGDISGLTPSLEPPAPPQPHNPKTEIGSHRTEGLGVYHSNPQSKVTAVNALPPADSIPECHALWNLFQGLQGPPFGPQCPSHKRKSEMLTSGT